MQDCVFCSPANKVASDRSSVKKGSRSAVLSCCKSVISLKKKKLYKTAVVTFLATLGLGVG